MATEADVLAAPPAAFLVAGAGGMLGTALQHAIASSGATLCAYDERGLDITDADAAATMVAAFRAKLEPGARGTVINAAAYTDVERAECEPSRAHLVNETGAATLARIARDAGLGFVHVSTDFVFDGAKVGAYTESDEPAPLSVYGASKLAGERVVLAEYPDALVVRTAWTYGRGGASFPAKILAAANERATLSVVTDEVGSPTYAPDLAHGILQLLGAGATGIYHLTGAGACSRFELARAVLDGAGRDDVVLAPVTADAFPTAARRPKNSVLDCSKAAALGVTLPAWRDGLARYLAETGAAPRG